MNKYRLKSGLIICLAAVALLAGCAGQLPQADSVKAEGSAGAHAEAANLVASGQIVTPGDKLVSRVEAEETPVIQEENAVFFTLGSATLKLKEKQKLEVIAQRLAADPSQRVLLLGHANDNGSSSYNLAVSDSRVTIVADFLRKQGVQSGRIRKQALGSEKVAASCRSSVCRQKSRRVDLVVSKAK